MSESRDALHIDDDVPLLPLDDDTADAARDRQSETGTATLEPPAPRSPAAARSAPSSVDAPTASHDAVARRLAEPPPELDRAVRRARDAEARAAGICPDCRSGEPWGHSSWCPRCGYYPLLGRRVELDDDAQAGADDGFSWERVFPTWLRILAAGVVGVLLLSVAGRLTTSASGTARTLWTVLQSLTGFLAFCAGHGAAFLRAVHDTDKYGPADVFMKPVEIWRPTLREAPKAAWKAWIAAWGATALFAAVLIVGGFRFEALFEDWGFKERVKPNVIQAVLKQAKEHAKDTDKSMEEALNDFAGEGAEEPQPDKRPVLECMVVGFRPQGEDDFGELHLAAVLGSRLAYVGSIPTDTLSPEDRKELRGKFRALRRKNPFVKTPVEGTWVEPRIMVRVRFDKWTGTGTGTAATRLLQPTFEKLLEDLDLEKERQKAGET